MAKYTFRLIDNETGKVDREFECDAIMYSAPSVETENGVNTGCAVRKINAFDVCNMVLGMDSVRAQLLDEHSIVKFMVEHRDLFIESETAIDITALKRAQEGHGND